MSFNKDPKDPKRSLRLKYNRRREYLRHILQQFIFFGEQRLDEDANGKIQKREQVERLVKGAKELLKLFPPAKEMELTEEDFKKFDEVLEQAGEETEQIMNDLKKEDEKYTALLRLVQESEKNKTNGDQVQE
jgi:hypothetical protein